MAVKNIYTTEPGIKFILVVDRYEFLINYGLENRHSAELVAGAVGIWIIKMKPIKM